MGYKYKVIADSSLCDIDRQALINLYQPIIGSSACAAYFTICEEAKIMAKLSNITFDQSRLSVILGERDDKVECYIRNLEGMNLLKRTKTKNSDLIKIYVKKPLSPKEFFDNYLYAGILRNKLDDDSFDVLKFHLGFDTPQETMINPELEEDMSVTFAEAFPTDFSKIKRNNEETITNFKVENNVPQFDMNHQLHNVNLSNLHMLMSIKGMNPTALTKPIVSLILNNLEEGITEDELVMVLQKSYDNKSHEISESYFNVLFKQLVISKQRVEKSPQEQKIYEMESMDPYDFATALLEEEPQYWVRQVIDKLQRKYDLPNGLVNCLLEFSYYKNDKKIVGSYLCKIAKSLNKKGINKTKEAMDYLKNSAKYADSDFDLSSEMMELDNLNEDSTKQLSYDWLDNKSEHKNQRRIDDLDVQLDNLLI
ncbi:DnaD domain protein [Mesoplasma lactucae]|nr:DnaD domain protein [Mesoplasma lactucae]ATZ19985.1 chromosome replication initiation and membrane attachment protein [Mesoplasma lactucae ATCC 49193]MCL8217064.1 Replication initiation and membrane attachment protein [Mesoplasma lactucae ATCC 49193]